MKDNKKYILGALLVVVGILIFFGRLNINLTWIFNLTWPSIILGISFLFFLGYYAKRPYGTGFLVPAGIFFTLGVTFLIGEIFSYRLVWSGFIAAPAVGLFLLYLFGARSAGLLVPVGTLFTIAGVCFLSELFHIWHWLWPGFIAAPAVGLLLLYIFGERKAGLLVPVGILLSIAGLCSFASIFNAWSIVWPGFIMAPAVGLFLLYIAGKRDSALLIPIFILTAISVMLFSVFCLGRILHSMRYLIGGALVIFGLITILKSPSKNNHDNYNDYNDNDSMGI
ncbi:MAG: hypothetical protein GX957_08915 [Clostridiaceae bacterium]|nr:hypothetical protein [Clostridiaceae bacterium]